MECSAEAVISMIQAVASWNREFAVLVVHSPDQAAGKKELRKSSPFVMGQVPWRVRILKVRTVRAFS